MQHETAAINRTQFGNYGVWSEESHRCMAFNFNLGEHEGQRIHTHTHTTHVGHETTWSHRNYINLVIYSVVACTPSPFVFSPQRHTLIFHCVHAHTQHIDCPSIVWPDIFCFSSLSLSLFSPLTLFHTHTMWHALSFSSSGRAHRCSSSHTEFSVRS